MVTPHNYAATPQRAAVQAVTLEPHKPIVVRRVNIVGQYATVLTSGGVIEGSPVTSALLVKRFSFGWQPLDVLNISCLLHLRNLEAKAEARLLHSMPAPKFDPSCRGLLRDAGASADVSAVRRLMRGPLVPYVGVYGNWSMGSWYGGGGGESLFRKDNGHWHLITHGGGAMGVRSMREYGVPQADWCKFGIYDAKCHGKA